MIKWLKYTTILFLICSFSQLFAPPRKGQVNLKKQANTWAEKTFDSMTVDERLGQLFMIECRPTYGQAHIAEVERMVQ